MQAVIYHGQTRTLRPYDGTRYEIELVAPDGTRRLVAYTGRYSQIGMRSAIQSRIDALLAIIPDGTGITHVGKGTRREWRLATGHVIRFSGRTEREAIANGELARIGADQE